MDVFNDRIVQMLISRLVVLLTPWEANVPGQLMVVWIYHARQLLQVRSQIMDVFSTLIQLAQQMDKDASQEEDVKMPLYKLHAPLIIKTLNVIGITDPVE